MCLLVLWAGCRQNTHPGVREQRPSPFTSHLLDLPDFPQAMNYWALIEVAECFAVLNSMPCSPSLFVFIYAEPFQPKKQSYTTFGD